MPRGIAAGRSFYFVTRFSKRAAMDFHGPVIPVLPSPALLIALVITGKFVVACHAEDHRATRRGEVDGSSFVVMTFNTGTTLRLRHDDPPDDGYTSAEARISDAWYGNGLAWRAAVKAVQRFLRKVDPDTNGTRLSLKHDARE